MADPQALSASEILDIAEGRLFRIIPDMVCIAGFDGFFKKVNPAWEAVLGWTREELLSRPFAEFVHPDDVQTTAGVFVKQKAGHDVLGFENRYRHRDGTWRWLSWHSFPIPGEHLVIAVAHDMTALRSSADEIGRLNLELKERAGQLESSRKYLEQIINAVGNPIFVKDRDHRWILLNDAYCRFMGYERGQLIGKSDRDFFPPAEADVFWEKDEAVFESGEPNVNEELFTDADGVEHAIVTKKALYVGDDGARCIVGVITDITDLRRSQNDLQKKMDEVERLNRFMIGREQRVIELKREVNAVLAELGRPPKFTI